MARMIGFCLTLGSSEAWSGFSSVAAVRLSDQERAALAYSALNSLTAEQKEMVATATIGAAGVPVAPLAGGMDEARFWASYANHSELKAYALAAFEAMSTSAKHQFLSYINQAVAAA